MNFWLKGFYDFDFIGGNKRRLSLGIALLTLPDVLLLDEPTTGVDPKASRLIWDILSKVRESDTALVLTSHSMEECDALCTQIAIMTNGEFRCLGSTQHIKSKYGIGYSLAIRLYTSSQIGSTKELIKKMFPDARLMDEHILHLNYELALQKGQTWSMLFEKVGKLAELIDAADYSISQTTLDQVIMNMHMLKFEFKVKYFSTSRGMREPIPSNSASKIQFSASNSYPEIL
uniref:ATPase_AAA_core domain-containing protein n=1 Tax=Elaeophora elaphi TaxID=1147741 RepID=A0A0R3RFF4_9BILA